MLILCTAFKQVLATKYILNFFNTDAGFLEFSLDHLYANAG